VNGPLIFAFGSLMWRPEVDVRARHVALLRGWHRAYCMMSTKGRGSEAQPGVMLGLLPGGETWGYALELDPADGDALARMDEREGEGRANRRVMLPIALGDSAQQASPRAPFRHAWVYVPCVSFNNYVGRLPHARLVELIATGVGERGSSLDYLQCMVRCLTQMGHEEAACTHLLAEAEALAAPGAVRTPA
jgi:cation transport protein ChaC